MKKLLSHQGRLLVLVVLILIGFALRLYRINAVPLRGDEAFTMLHWVREPLSQSLSEIATKDPQPPLAYIVYHLWGQVVGTGELTIRFLPAFLNLVGISVLYALGKRIGGTHLGLLAAFLWAIHPFQIWHAQDARNYAIWGALSPLAMWLALRALERNRQIDWVLYVVGAVLAAYIYYLELFSIFVLTVYVFIVYGRANRRLLMKWFRALIMIGAGLSIWYLQGRLLFGSGYGGTAGNFDPMQWFTWFVPTLTFGDTLSLPVWGILLLLGMLIFGGVLLYREGDVQKRYALLLGLMGTIPLVLLGIVSLRLNVFTPRYVLLVSSVFVLLLSGLLVFVRKRSWLLSTFAMALIVGGSFLSLNNHFFLHDYAKSPNWRALTNYLQTRVTTDSLIVLTSADEAYTFYHGETGITADFVRLPANPNQSAAEITSTLDTAMRHLGANDSLWIVAQPPPLWENRAVVDEWLTSNMQLVRSTVVDDLLAREFRPWTVNSAEISLTPLAEFPQIAELAGTIILPPDPTNTLTVWVYWRALDQTAEPLKAFVHLTGSINPATNTPLWSQDDHFPPNIGQNTANWIINTVYRDIFVLPLEGVTAGEYSIEVGLYDPITSERILTTDQRSSVTVQSITLP